MKTIHYNRNKNKYINKKNTKTLKKKEKFIFPIAAASNEFSKSKSLLKARAVYRAKALYDARKIYGFFVNKSK